jgi:hypothetical protein
MTFAALMNLSDSKVSWVQQSRVLGLVIKPLLDALVMDDQLFLRLHHAPPLYQSGVRYREEPPTYVTFSDGQQRAVEEFASAAIVLGRLWGDCDDLAPYHAASLRHTGEDEGATAIVKRSGVWIHFQIRRGEIPERTRQSFERDVYLYVDNVDALHAELKQRGATIPHAPQLAPYGIRELEVIDLNGYRLTFGEFTPA